MRGLQGRLLAYGGARWHLLLTALVGAAQGALLVAQAALLGTIVAGVVMGHEGPGVQVPRLGLLAATFTARGCLAWLAEVAGQVRAASVRTRLRQAVCARVLELGPDDLAADSRGALATAVTDGVDALDAFYARYVPQLVLAVVVPLLVVGWILPHDWVSALIMVLTLPLIPTFMALIGLTARDQTDRRWRALARLGGHFLDVLRGLPTLRIYGRSRQQAAAVGRVTERYRAATMATLRVAFLSSMVLELAAAASTALVAVAIGLRLDDGGMGLASGLAILILTPEVYLPLRRLGAEYHASMDAMAPAEQLFALLDRPAPLAGGSHRPDLRRDTIRLTGVRLARPGRGPVLAGLDLTVAPGERVAVVGPSGAGKTTLLHILLGLLRADAGEVRIGHACLDEIALPGYREQIGWVPQRPQLFAGTIEDNLRMGAPGASPADLVRCLEAVGLTLPLDRLVDEGGAGLSAGQRQRLALARALARNPALVVLDEPTAHLDQESAAFIARWLERAVGMTVVVATHSPVLAERADRRVDVPELAVEPAA